MESLRDRHINGVHVFGEPVEDASQGCGVEEGHGRIEDVVQHAVVKGPGGEEACYGEEERG